jgi:hypothetical protein
MKLNGHIMFKDDLLQKWHSIIEQTRPSNEEESLEYYYNLEESKSTGVEFANTPLVNTTTHVATAGEVITPAILQTRNNRILKEMYHEGIARLRKLGYLDDADTNEEAVIYSARDHFMLPGHNMPFLEADKIDFTLSVDASNLFCYPDRTIDPAAGNYGMRFSELSVYIYYYELPEYKKEVLR